MSSSLRFTSLCLSLALLLGTAPIWARPGRPTTAGQRSAPAAGTQSRTSGSAQQARASLQSKMSPQQQQNLARLQQDLAGLKSGSEVSQAQKDALTASLTTLAQGTVKPSPSSVSKLSGDLSSAMADGDISKAEQVQLTQDVAVVMNSANIPTSEVQAVIGDVQSILLSSNVDKADVQTITSDLQAIADELQSNAR